MSRALACVVALVALSGCGPDGPPPASCSDDAQIGAGCGPCGLDHLVCMDGEAVCDGATDCGYGAICAAAVDCERGTCTAGYCAPPGMAYIPAGVFQMGSVPGEIGRVEGETPHPVRLTRHYFMGITEVTQREWNEMFPDSPAHFRSCGDDCPVDSVRWVEALAYANARSDAEGLERCYDLSVCTGRVGVDFVCQPPLIFDLDCTGYRIPTEAEWEHAYRALTTTSYYNGDPVNGDTCNQPILEEIARFCGNCENAGAPETADCTLGGARPDQPAECTPAPVGTYAPNSWGLFDMSGNLSEFVWDVLAPYSDFAEDPIGPAEGQGHLIVIRGSNMCGHMARLRAADRKYTSILQRDVLFGVRLARTYRPAREGETVGEHLCENGCGGCRPIVPGPEQPCVACADGRFVCSGVESTTCQGGTSDCDYGSQCSDAEPCSVGHCSQGHCVPDDWVYVPAGAFPMGSPPLENGHRDDERLHDVLITRPFMAMRHEVTQIEWRRLEGSDPSLFRACGEDCPVDQVSWVDALDYANRLSASQGLEECYDLSGCTGHPGVDLTCPVLTFSLDCQGYRLPTEAEWEHAYRAGRTTAFQHADVLPTPGCDQPGLEEVAQYCGNCVVSYEGSFDCSRFSGPADCGPRPVMSFAANDWGLFDMAGNVSELVWDELADYPAAAQDPTGPEHAGGLVVARGGQFCSQATRVRAASRQGVGPFGRAAGMGFRLVRSLEPDGTIGTMCDNGCGGCTPIVPAAGLPCGPCAADAYECSSMVDTTCGGNTTGCRIGGTCAVDTECPFGDCSNGRCVIPGFAYAPPGTFTMGSPPTEIFHESDETQHTVALTEGLLVSRMEVTQAEWRGLFRSLPTQFRECGATCPVDAVTWPEALAYANALSRSQGLPECYDLSACTGEVGATFDCPISLTFDSACMGYRLPTEAEWEYIYRAGSTTALHNGEPTSGNGCVQPLLDAIAQYCGDCEVTYPAMDCTPFGGTANCGPTVVGSRTANPWGVYDLSGNVSEWVWDVYAPYTGPATDPRGPIATGMENIVRGGSFCQNLTRMRAADRVPLNRNLRRAGVGLRVVRRMP
ncbi:MAG: formylglycine-generating enzyme family protein [Sandaracinaceae bacterium]